jgi:hypothetical protein
MNETEFQSRANPSEGKTFSPKIVIYNPWSAVTLKRFLEIYVSDASIFAEVGLTGVMTALDQSAILPDAYFIDAPVLGTDWECVNQAIIFLNAHKDRMTDEQKQPDIFLIRSNRSGESAREIVDRTGFSIFHLREETFALLNAHGKIESFQFLKDASKLIIPLNPDKQPLIDLKPI